MPVAETDLSEVVGRFCVPKSSMHDRLILSPTTINSRMLKHSNFTRYLAPGSLLCLAHLEAHEVLRMCADDLGEMYYTFEVPPSRARRNAIRMVFQPEEVWHFSCFKKDLHMGPLVLALSTLAMGDSHAVEIAQQAHYIVLAMEGHSMLQSEVACYRQPFPRSDCVELLAIDGHLPAQKVTRLQDRLDAPARDTRIFAGAEAAYKHMGLIQHETKRKRYVKKGNFLGAQIDGEAGLISAPLHRIGFLCSSLPLW